MFFGIHANQLQTTGAYTTTTVTYAKEKMPINGENDTWRSSENSLKPKTFATHLNILHVPSESCVEQACCKNIENGVQTISTRILNKIDGKCRIDTLTQSTRSDSLYRKHKNVQLRSRKPPK